MAAAYRDAIRTVEDVAERPYRIDRMLTQLKLAGKLGHLNVGTMLAAADQTERSARLPSSSKIVYACATDLSANLGESSSSRTRLSSSGASSAG